jgi:hypothetical protein
MPANAGIHDFVCGNHFAFRNKGKSWMPTPVGMTRRTPAPCDDSVFEEALLGGDAHQPRLASRGNPD